MADPDNKQWFEQQKGSSKGRGRARSGSRPANQRSAGKNNPGKTSGNSINKTSGKTSGKGQPGSGKRPELKADPKKGKDPAPVKKGIRKKELVKDETPKTAAVNEATKAHSGSVKNEKAASEADVKDDYSTKQRKRAKKKILSKAVIGAIVGVLALMILVFVFYHLDNYIAAKPEFMFISEGSVEHTIGARALIVRDETVVPSNASGDLVTQATEGSRVAKDQRIAMVVPESMSLTVDNLRNTQNQISEVQQELIQTGRAEGAESIYSNINGSIEPIVDMIRLDAMNGNMSDMSSYAASVSVLISQRESELAQLEFDDERLKVLRDDEASYEAMLQRSAHRVTAPCPGIISFKLDGQEEALSFDYLLTADPSLIREVISDSVGIITSDLDIAENEPVARIARNEEQYIAVYLDSGDASQADFEVGSLHTLNVGSEGVVIDRCEVVRSTSTSGGLLIVFSTTRYVEDLLDLRTVDIEIVISERSGLKVPVSSLVDADYDRGIATVYYNNQGFADEIGVIIEDYDREFAIIAPIGDSSIPNTQTVIVTNPSSIKPGEKVTN